MSVPRSFIPVMAGVMAYASLLAFPTEAWAYLDLGTGSYLFQLAIAGLFAGMMTIKLYYQRLQDWIRARLAPPPPPPPASDDPKPS